MNRNSLTTAVIAGIAGVAGIANMASAVNLNPDGLGQVLLYPYYTVNGGQQTLLSVVNTAAVGKAVKVRFLEGYNSREVLDFNLFLSPFDVWTASVFALADIGAGPAGSGGAITTTDRSCTYGTFSTPSATLNGGAGGTYQAFKADAYTGSYTDSGPTSITRTQEGHFEMITMADIVTGSPLYVDTFHDQTKNPATPPGCAKAETDFVVPGGGAVVGNSVAPTSGIFGSAAVVNVGNGTYYGYTADALDGFTSVNIASDANSLLPSLSSVNDPGLATATSYVFDDGILAKSVYPAVLAQDAIDAVSSVFMAANIYNEYESNAGNSGTDWVITFPTKRFYVDPLYTGNSTDAYQPFEEVFGEKNTSSGPGLSCVVINLSLFNREEGTITPAGCQFSPCTGQPASSICYETNVITFNANSDTSSVLHSTLNRNVLPNGIAGWADLSLVNDTRGHILTASTNGNVFRGEPTTGFSAVQFTNGSLQYNGATVLSNYSGVFRHRLSRDCTNAGGVCS